MKLKMYVRIGDTPRQYKIAASNKPIYEPVWTADYGAAGGRRYHPTVAFAIDVVLPDDAFRQAAKSLGEVALSMGDLKIATSVVPPEEEQEAVN